VRTEAKDGAIEGRALLRQQMPDDRDRLPHRRDGLRLRDAERLQPRPAREAEVGASAGDGIEQRDLPGDLDRVERVRIHARRAEPDARRRLRHDEERSNRRLVHQITIDAQRIEPILLHPPRQRRILRRPFIALKRHTHFPH
jgi:hypothetical protein